MQIVLQTKLCSKYGKFIIIDDYTRVEQRIEMKKKKNAGKQN